jgi:vanillate O-demethylase monooxygenase subunit
MYPFKQGSFAPRNAWYIAAFGKDVGRNLVSRVILDQPVVLYRKENGTAVAVGGRCPHRHFPLGKGCLKGDVIVCGYHGISFGANGACTSVPSQKFIPPSFRIPTYPLVERGMWLWIWPGEPELADPGLLPDVTAIEAPGMHSAALFTYEVKCRYQLFNDNLLDLTHLAFLHGTTIGTLDNATVPEERTHEPRSVRSRRHMKAYRMAPVAAAPSGGYNGLVDSVVGMDYHPPGFHVGIGDLFVASTEPERAGEALRISRTYHGVTPGTPHTMHYFFGVAGSKPTDLQAANDLLRPVIAEDILASEEIEKMIDLLGEAPQELMLPSDSNAVFARRILQSMMDAEGNAPASRAAAS